MGLQICYSYQRGGSSELVSQRMQSLIRSRWSVSYWPSYSDKFKSAEIRVID
jgi:hypothetical protein